MAEYLTYPEPEWLQMYSLEEMMKVGRVIAPALLRLHIIPEAKKLLVDTAGPNWDRRQVLGSAWMSAISHYLTNFPDDGGLFVKDYHMVEFSTLGKRLDTHRANGNNSGVLFMATGEANLGTLSAWDWMREHVAYPVGLFEPENYFEVNPERRKPFLPLKVRLSVACLFGLYSSVLTERNVSESESVYYQRMFNLSGADYCFVSEGDPNQVEKMHRGMWANFLLIPNMDYPRTSDAAQKLMPDPEDLF